MKCKFRRIRSIRKRRITYLPFAKNLTFDSKQRKTKRLLRCKRYSHFATPTICGFKRFEKLLLAKDELEFPFVWKCAQFGYDGNGVKICRSSIRLGVNLPDVECIAEEMVPFKNELAVIVARSVSGEVKTYPVVEMEFHPEANQVEYVICPARIDEKVAQKATEIALKVSEAFYHVGLLAVEMFQTEDDEILVNEVAPRPHNSGHYSIEASYTSQFENHLRAILNLTFRKYR